MDATGQALIPARPEALATPEKQQAALQADALEQ